MVCGAYIFSLIPPANFFAVIRLCTETPTAGGRVFEVGDEELLKLAHETGSAPLTSL